MRLFLYAVVIICYAATLCWMLHQKTFSLLWAPFILLLQELIYTLAWVLIQYAKLTANIAPGSVILLLKCTAILDHLTAPCLILTIIYVLKMQSKKT